MRLNQLIDLFCERNPEKYEAYPDYSGKFLFGKKCMGIVVKKDYSYMTMLIELTRFLDENDYEDQDLELENPAVDALGLDTIVYFPFMKMN